MALVGVSFAGGLALVAAGRPSLTNRLDAVVSLGGHGDLERTLQYLCTGLLPDGTVHPPHDYGLAVVALAAVPRLVPASQTAGLTHAIGTYLEASLDDSATRARGMALLAQARTEAAALPDPSRTIMTALTNRDVTAAGRWLAPLVTELSRDPALSPESSPPTLAPVFLCTAATITSFLRSRRLSSPRISSAAETGMCAGS